MNRININLQWLYSYLILVEQESFTKAAKILNVSQPALSKQMSYLEQTVKKTLIERDKGHVGMTEDGLYFRTRAEEILSLLEQTINDLAPAGKELTGDIILGCGETVGMSYITNIFTKLQKDYPKLKLHLVSGDAHEIAERLLKGNIDMALVVNPKGREEFDYLDFKHDDRFGLLMKADDALAQRASLSLEEAIKLPLMFPSRIYTESRYTGWHGIPINDLNVVSTYNLISNATYLVEQGMGYAVSLDALVNIRGRNLTFVPFEPKVSVPLYLVTKKYKSHSPAAKLFLQYIKEALENE